MFPSLIPKHLFVLLFEPTLVFPATHESKELFNRPVGGRKKNRCSSGSEDRDADWRTAIDSIAAATTFTSSTAKSNGNGVPYSCNGRATTDSAIIATREDKDENHKPPEAQTLPNQGT
ncbi:Uncharacterized protein Adt_22591 [Abeliophyllum distichum]|uniref:Secreted protein n=1 Tax=Abeliophyllum distichum TaxID=126358 RepID=A0ABD1S9A4_9LAMI